MVKNLIALLLFSIMFVVAYAQQADSDKKDSLGHARPAITANAPTLKPTSALKKDVEPVKSSSPQQLKPVSTIKPSSDKKNQE